MTEPARVRREIQRVADRQVALDLAQERIYPAVAAVCKLYRVTVEDIVSKHSRHPDVVFARRILLWIGWSHYKIAIGILADVLKCDRPHASKSLTTLKAEMLKKGTFWSQVRAVLRKIEP